jgi:pectinesterase
MFHAKALLLATLGVAAVCLGAPAAEKRATSRTSAPSGCLSVKPGTTTSGWYQTLTAALNSLSGSSSACIFLYSGTYNEQVTISYGGPLTLYGYTTE